MKHNWEYKKLGEVCEVLDSKRKPVTKKDRKEGQYPYFGAMGIQDYVDAYIFDGDYLLVGEDGAKWGANDKSAFQVHGKCWVNNHAHILRINETVVNTTFIEYYLVGKDLSSYITGAVVPKLTQASLVSIPIPLSPLPIQQKIVSELDKLSLIIEKKKQQLTELDRLAQAIFYDMFGDPDSIFTKWNHLTLEDVCSNIVDCPHTTPIKSEIPTLYPCIRTSELKGGSIHWETMQYVTEDEYNNRVSRLIPQVGDIVYGREGSFGDAVILPSGWYFCLGQRTMLFRANRDFVNIVFLHRVLISEVVFRQAKEKNVASTVAHVNVKDIKKFIIPIPPLALQQSFAAKIEAIERQKELINASIREAQTLFDARMDYWFNEA